MDHPQTVTRKNKTGEENMSDMTRRSLLTLPALIPFVGGMWAAAALSPDEKRSILSPREKIRRRYFPDVTVVTHEGKRVQFYDDLIKDRILLINMMYAHCADICPMVTSNLVKVQRLLKDFVGRDIFMLSLTLSPQTDSPKVLRDYMKGYGIGPGWTFVTGEPETMELLRRKLGFRDPDPELDKDITQHIGNVRYGNEPKMIWGACPGMSKPTWIATLLADAIPSPLKEKVLSAVKSDREGLAGEVCH
jgi:protein SCO1/2